MLVDPQNNSRITVLGSAGQSIVIDSLKMQWAGGLSGYSFDRGSFDLAPSDLHEAARRHFKMGEFAVADVAAAERDRRIQKETAARAATTEAMRAQAAARQSQINADNALAAKQQRELAEAQRARAAAAAANSPMAVYQRKLAQQPKPAPTTEITVNSPALDAIAEQMRLDRVRQQVQQARREGRPYYVSPADARALGF